MRILQKSPLLIIVLLFPSLLKSQEIPFTFTKGKFVKEKITILSADIPRLKSAELFNSKIEIENMRIGNSKHLPDSIYIQRRVDELNAKKKSRGDEWLKGWEDSKSYYLPAFMEGYNTQISTNKKVPGITIKEGLEFTIILRPDTITVSNKYLASFLSMHLYIVSSKDNNDTIASFKTFTFHIKDLSKIYPGSEASSFYMAGEMLARYFKKYMYKK